MYYLHKTFLYAHVIVGALSLIVFWLPIAARKGSDLHRRAGQWFERTMSAVVLTALGLAALLFADPVAVRYLEPDLDPETLENVRSSGRIAALFLLMLSLLVFVSIRQGVMAVRHKLDRSPMRRPSHVVPIVLLLVVAIPVGILGFLHQVYLLTIFSAISVFAAWGALHYLFRREVGAQDWLFEHFGGFIGAGIGAYTAFFAFGGARFLRELLPGQWQIVPWVLPAIVGAIFARRLRSRYEPARTPAAVSSMVEGDLR